MDPSKGPPTKHRPRRAWRQSLRRRLCTFRRHEGGATVVEFGLISVPFLALLFAILETSIVFWTSQVVETAVADAARTIYTGQFQGQNASATNAVLASEFKKRFCSRINALFQCTESSSTVHVDVRVVTSTIPPVITNGAINPDAFRYETTKANDIVLVRVAVEYPVFSTLLNPNQANLSNGKRLIMGAATFRNEPF